MPTLRRGLCGQRRRPGLLPQKDPVGGAYSLGTVFSLDSTGNEKVLYSFAGGSDGANPIGGPVLDQAGNLYGATSAGGPNYFGTLFMIDTAGNESVLYSFTGGTDGAYPYSHLLVDGSGNLFGTASQGGCCGLGSIFEFSNGTLTALYGFSAAPNGTNPDGQVPMGGLMTDSAGNFYGTATEAGPDGWGAVFELQLGGQALEGQSEDGKALQTRSDLTRFSPAAGQVPESAPMSSEFMPPNALKLEPICNPTISAPVEVASSHQRYVAGTKAQPPLTDSFDWPDGQLSALKTDGGYMFFSIDAGLHNRQLWHGHMVGNNSSGSVVRTIGTLDNPLGSALPVDVVIDPNPDPNVNPHNCDPTKYPHHFCYTYIGGGPVYQVPQSQVGAGNWLLVYHAEYDDPAYFLLGLAVSSDKGLHWTDIGEIIRFNKPFSYQGQPAPGAIGDPPLVVSPDGKYFYVYFLDWLKNGINTTASVARVPIPEVLHDAFGGHVHFAAPFKKYYQGAWDQPGIGGASTDLIPEGHYGGGNNVAYNSYLHRYLMLNSDSQNYSYAESIDGLYWTDTIFLGMLGYVPDIAGYSGPIGTGADPAILGKEFYVYYTQFRGPWTGAQSVKRFTLSCR